MIHEYEEFHKQVKMINDIDALAEDTLYDNGNEESYYIEDDEDGNPVYDMERYKDDLRYAIGFLNENCSFNDPNEPIAIARCIKLDDISSFDTDYYGNSWTSPKHFYDFAQQNLGRRDLYCITGVTRASNIDWVKSASLYIYNDNEYELYVMDDSNEAIKNVKLWKVEEGKMKKIVKSVPMKETIMINGEEYYDSYGEDLNTSGLKDTDYQFANVDGVKKRLYKVAGKLNKSTGKRSPDKYYAKLCKHESVTEIDNANSWADDYDGEDYAILDGKKIKVTAYKQFKVMYDNTDEKTRKETKYALAPDGEPYLYPLFVKSYDGKKPRGIEIGKWYRCGVGELKVQVDPITGEPIQGAALQVDSELGNLSYRPGWHLASLPLTAHIGKNSNGKKRKDGGSGPADYEYTCSQYVWCKVEYSAHFDFTDKAKKRPGADTDSKKACFTNKHDFDDGFYHYKTNTNASDDEDWLIADAIKVIRVLEDDEVQKIVGDKAQKRWIADKSSKGCNFMVDFSLFKKRLEDVKDTSKKDTIFNDIFDKSK